MFHAAGARNVFPEQTTQQPRENSGKHKGSATRGFRRDERERRADKGAFVRAEGTIYGHFVAEKEDRRNDEEHRVPEKEEGRVLRGGHVPRADFSTVGQRFGRSELRGEIFERSGTVV